VLYRETASRTLLLTYEMCYINKIALPRLGTNPEPNLTFTHVVTLLPNTFLVHCKYCTYTYCKKKVQLKCLNILKTKLLSELIA